MSQYDMSTGEKIKDYTGYTSEFKSIAFSQDSKFMIYGNQSTYKTIVNIKTSEKIYEYSTPKGTTPDIACSPDNKYICTGSKVTLWHARWGEVGVEEDDEEETLLYPNPTNGIVTLRLTADHPEESYIELFDNLGNIQFELNHPLGIGINDIPLDISQLSTGSYLIRLTTNSFSKIFN
jgi:WD40 repeat protein